MIVYHHNDMDGMSSAYLVHSLKPKTIPDYPESYVKTTYEDTFDKHSTHDDVFIVDLSFTEKTYPELIKICKTARTVTWIDHHASSINVIKNHKDELQNIKNLTYFVSIAACGAALTYAYFQIPSSDLKKIRGTSEDDEYDISATYDYNGNENAVIHVTASKVNKNDPMDYVMYNYDVKLPRWLFFVDDFDSWKQLNPMTEMFKFGIESFNCAFIRYSKSQDKKYFNPFWNKFNKDDPAVCNDIINRGIPISNHVHSENHRELCHTFLWTYKGTTFICQNTMKKSSMTFEHMMDRYTAAIAFSYSGKTGMWMYSVYSTKEDFDCKEFCEQFGGGGHKGAAGFSSKKLIFTDPKFMQETVEKDRVIFLGGTCNDDPWREEFISCWNKHIKEDNRYAELKDIKLFNPVVEDWNSAAQEKEEKMKKSAMVNLFVITPNMSGVFSIAEAVECSHRDDCITMFVVYDKYNSFAKSQRKSLEATGKMISEKQNSCYLNITGGDDACDRMVTSVLETLIK